MKKVQSAEHVDNVAVKDLNHNDSVSGQSSIENSLKKAESLAGKARKIKDQTLEAEFMLARHGRIMSQHP